MPPKRTTFCTFAILGMASGRAYAIRPYRVTRKCDPFSRSIMYPVNFLGLGRGLDFLLPSFLSSRKEKKVEVVGIRPTGCHPKNGKCTKHVNFSGYNDRTTSKRVIFLGYSFHRWNVRRAYAIRPYLVTRKHGTFSIPHTYPVNFPGPGRGLDFLLPSFLVSRQEKKVEAYCIRPTEHHSKNGECTKRVNFSGYNDRVI